MTDDKIRINDALNSWIKTGGITEVRCTTREERWDATKAAIDATTEAGVAARRSRLRADLEALQVAGRDVYMTAEVAALLDGLAGTPVPFDSYLEDLQPEPHQ